MTIRAILILLLAYIWFDTPGDMPANLVKELADYVRQAQPGSLLCSRIGHGMGDYASKGDNYKGEGRPVWRIETDENEKLQNQQNSSAVYHTYPFGLLSFAKAGKYKITLSLIDGDRAKASLSAVRITPMG